MDSPTDPDGSAHPSIWDVASTQTESGEQGYRNFFMAAYVGFFRSDLTDGRIIDCNACLANMFGYPDRDMVLKTGYTANHYASSTQRAEIIEELRRDGAILNRDLQLKRASGELFWVNYSCRINAGEGTIECAVIDIDARKHQETDLERLVAERTGRMRESQKMLQLVMDNIPQAIFWKDEDLVYRGCNRRFAEHAGFRNPRDLVGKTDFDLPWKRSEAEWYRDCDKAVMKSKQAKRHIVETQKQADGTEAWVNTNKIPLMNEAGKVVGILGTYEDITVHKRREEALRKLENYDVLTGLANRKLFKERLDHALGMERMRRGSGDKIHALLLIDLDHFKTINDSLGHHFGDRLLVAFGHRLRRHIPLEHMVARLGGDEFGVLLENVGAPERAGAIASELMETLKQPCMLEGHEIVVTPSIGIAAYPQHGETPKDLLRNADAAMFHAKALGRDNYRFFSEELNVKAVQRLELETRLRRAIENNDFEVYYQPKINIRSGAFTGVEALMRWVDPEQGLIGPDTFIGFAEENGLITRMSEIILRKACRAAERWHRDGLPFGRLAVNVSPHQFRQGNLAEWVKAVLDDTGLPPSSLELEITESALMGDTGRAAQTMQKLRDWDIHLSLDDFGTGFSSLSMLKHFPLNTLKIDRSFITDIARSTKDRNIAASIVGIGHYMGLEVVAEGVENRDQVGILKELRCSQMQGYYFSEPLPEDQMTVLLTNLAGKKSL